jgi:hypothetical protein
MTWLGGSPARGLVLSKLVAMVALNFDDEKCRRLLVGWLVVVVVVQKYCDDEIDFVSLFTKKLTVKLRVLVGFVFLFSSNLRRKLGKQN